MTFAKDFTMPLAPRDRKAELVRRGVKQADIARQTGFSQSLVTEVVRGTRRNDAIEAAIAKAIERKPQDVFPPRAA